MKINDYIICVTDLYPSHIDPVFNKIYKVFEINITNDNIRIIENKFDWWNKSNFRLLTSFELRKLKGFSEELEGMINS